MLQNSKLVKTIIISLMFINFVGCDDNEDWIPYVPVDMTLHFTQLSTIGILQAKTFPGGVNGIIIFRTTDKKFNAFDMTCPYQPSANCAVDFNEEILAAVCPCCESQFELIEAGAVQKGPARRPLKQYRAVMHDTYLRITN